MDAYDESNITEFEFLSDGRICIFGASREVLEVLDRLQYGHDDVVSSRLNIQQEQVAVSQPIAAVETGEQHA